MSTPMRNIAVLALIGIVGFGAYWLGRQQGEVSALSSRLAGLAAPQIAAGLQEENNRLAAENDRLMKEGATRNSGDEAPVRTEVPANSTPAGAAVERLRLLTELQQKHLAAIAVSPVGRDGKLPDTFVELFALSPSERSTLQEAVDQARQQVEQAQGANANVSRRSDGTVVISVPASEAGKVTRDNLLNAFAQTLGSERNEVFLALSQGNPSSQLANALSGFGLEERTVTISRRAPSNENPSTISVQDVHRNPTGGTNSFGTSVTDLSRLPENLRWAVPLMPADF